MSAFGQKRLPTGFLTALLPVSEDGDGVAIGDSYSSAQYFNGMRAPRQRKIRFS